MSKLQLLDTLAVAAMVIAVSTPAQAGAITPAPVAGVGLAALAVLGLGYRALRNRIDR